MRSKLIICALIFFCHQLAAQNAPAFRQFFFNPFQFNAAYAGHEGYTNIFIYHRQQWIDINSSPFATGFNVQVPTYRKVAFGFSFTSQETVGLQNTSALLTLAYRLTLSTDHVLSFGLSGGMGANRLNLDDGDYSNDPTIIGATEDAFYADGNFGLLYEWGRLRIGFALPRLFSQKYFSQQELGDIRYSQLLNQLYSITYKFNMGRNFSLEPYFLYRLNRDNQNYWEGSGLVYFKDKVWLGASYNETQGIGLFFGMDIKEKFRFGYSYELPPVSPDFISTSSHEFQLQLRLGKKRTLKLADKSTPTPVTVAKAETEILEPKKEAEAVQSQPIETVESKVSVENVNQPDVKEEVTVEVETEEPLEQILNTTPPRQLVFAKGHYVIVGSFGKIQNASNERDRFIRLGYADAYFSRNPDSNLYCVYIFASSDLYSAQAARDHYREMSASRSAWILTID